MCVKCVFVPNAIGKEVWASQYGGCDGVYVICSHHLALLWHASAWHCAERTVVLIQRLTGLQARHAEHILYSTDRAPHPARVFRVFALQSAAYSSGYGGLSSLSGISNISSSSIGLALTPPQPHKVWIGRPTAVTDEGFAPCGLGPEGLGLVGEQELEGMAAGSGAVSGGGGVVGSRRASRQRGSGRLPSGAVNLPSLVAA